MSDENTSLPSVGATTTSYQATESDLKQRSQELGLMGKIFGSKEQAPINVAGLMVILGFVGMFSSVFFPASQQGDLIKIFSGLIVAAVTFLGGYLGGKQS